MSGSRPRDTLSHQLSEFFHGIECVEDLSLVPALAAAAALDFEQVREKIQNTYGTVPKEWDTSLKESSMRFPHEELLGMKKLVKEGKLNSHVYRDLLLHHHPQADPVAVA